MFGMVTKPGPAAAGNAELLRGGMVFFNRRPAASLLTFRLRSEFENKLESETQPPLKSNGQHHDQGVHKHPPFRIKRPASR
jgi:hypothetical protein